MGRSPSKAALVSAAAAFALAACSSGDKSTPVPPLITNVVPQSGPIAGGTAATVFGAAFQPGAVVAVGGTPAAISSLSATSIGIVTPPHAAGLASVTVTNPDGQSATRAGGFRYLGPAPVLSSVSPGSGSIAGGTAVTLSGSSFQAGATVTLDGFFASVTSLSATSIAIVTPPRPEGPADVTVTNPDGQSSTLAGGFTYFSTPPTTRVVTLSWTANHEAGVNQAGGGYRIAITGQPTVVVPWVTPGPLAPTTKDVTLPTGSYTVTITAFAALDAQGGLTGSLSAPSQPITVVVP